MEGRIFHDIQREINEGFDIFGLDRNGQPEINVTNINYEDLEREILRLIKYTKRGLFMDKHFHSIFIYGPTGVAKTEITEQLAKREGCVYHKLEIQKIPIEILQGFPYLEDLENGEKVAKLAPSTILPPSGDERTWILHFDEFNKADAEKMAAVMNLILTGELGGSSHFDKATGKSVKYKLPRKTVIIGTGNPKIQENVENMNIVNQMDTATSERWHRTVFLGYNAESWFRAFASKPCEVFGEKLTTRVPGILLNYILDQTLESGENDTAFIIPIVSGSEEGTETERTTSPRAWTLVGNNMILDGFAEWQEIEASDKEPFVKLGEKYNKSPFDMFMQNPSNQMRFLANQVYEFGIHGQGLVKEIITRYIYFAENRILPEDVLFNYKHYREKVKKLKDKRGAILYLLFGVGYFIDTVEKIEDPTAACINISTFIEDNEISVEDVAVFIRALDYSKNQEVTTVIHDTLFDLSEKYRDAYSGYKYTGEDEV